MQPIVVTVGPLAAGNTTNIALAQQPAAGNLVLNGSLVTAGVATLDQPRTITITSTDNETANVFNIQGTDWAGSLISENLSGGNSTGVTSVLSYKTITKIANSGNVTANITAGTASTASSPWVRFDTWSVSPITKQAVVSAAPLVANFTVQVSMDDPNSNTNPVAVANMTWFNDSDTNFVAKATSAQGVSAYIPLWMRIFLNSGNGTVTGTFAQAGSVTY